ncbi:hypothetical protein Tco_0433197 [Tanacetum coccineum]
MAVLESCPKHNMVAYLEKTKGNAEFHEVIVFLARSSIHHALTVSPVVSTTFVEQFWVSAKSKIINNIRYITAKVAGKPVSISEASIRSNLLFDDADGIDSLPNQAIFDAIQLMGYEGDLTVLTFNKAFFHPNGDAKKKFIMYPRFILIFLDKKLVNVPVPLDHFPVNALTSKVFSFMLKKGKHFSGKIIPLFASMLVQSIKDEGATSERPSEPQPTPSPPHPSKANIEPQSDPSPRPSPTPHIPDSILEVSGGNHGGLQIKANEIKTLEGTYKESSEARKKSLKSNWMQKESVSKQIWYSLRTRNEVNAEKEGTEDAVSTEDVDKDSTVSLDEGTDDRTEARSATPITSTNTPTMFGRDETIAQLSDERPRPTSTRSLLTLKPLPKIDPKDKGKKKIEEEDKSDTESEDISKAKKKFKQLAKDEEMARKLQADWETEEERKRLAEEEATKTALLDEYDFIQARIEADRLLALRLQDEEREQFTVEERAKFLHDTIAAQRRFLTEQRAIAIRNKPPTRTQLRNQMMTYLKHVGNKKHSYLMSKTFEEIQALYKKVKRFDESFTTIGSTEDERRIKEMNEGVKDTDQKRLKEEDTSHVPAKVEVTEQANGNFIAFNYLMEDDEDEFWNSQQDWNIVSWKLHGSFGVHTLVTEEGLVIHMLVEKKYSLRKKVLLKMLELKLESEEDSTMALELIRFVKKLLAELEPEDSDGDEEDL